MAKTVIATVKLQIPAGNATPGPPVGPALGQHGVNIMEFCNAFNARSGIVMVGGAVTHPAATPEPDVRLSPHPALEHQGLCHRHYWR